MGDKQHGRAIIIATRPGFFARMQLRSPVFEMLRQSGRPLVVLWPIPNDDRLRKELAAPNVFIEQLYTRHETTYVRSLLKETFQRMRVYVHPNEISSTAHTQRLNQLRSFIQSELWRRRFLWQLTIAGARLANRSAMLRRGLLAAEHRVFRSTAYQGVFERYKPGVVVTGTPGYFPWYEDAYLIREARQAGIPTICNVLSWDNPSTKGALGAIPDYSLVWTEEMKREFVLFHDVDPERIYVTGTPLFDVYVASRDKDHRKELIAQYGLDPARKTILLGTMSPTSYRYNAAIAEILVRALVEGRFVEPVQIIIRPHPINYNGDVNPDVHRMRALMGHSPHVHISTPQVLPGNTLDLSWTEVEQMVRLINGSDIVVNMFSTMQLEAALADKPIINVAFDPGPVLPNEKSLAEIETNYHIARLVRTGGIRLARTPQDLLAQINQYLVDPRLDRKGRKVIVQQESGPLDGRSAQRIAEFILAVAEGNIVPRL